VYTHTISYADTRPAKDMCMQKFAGGQGLGVGVPSEYLKGPNLPSFCRFRTLQNIAARKVLI
jgi:hypothetical protein